MAEPSVKTIKALSRTSKIMIGANHHFFRTFKKPHNSDKIANFDMLLTSCLIMKLSYC